MLHIKKLYAYTEFKKLEGTLSPTSPPVAPRTFCRPLPIRTYTGVSLPFCKISSTKVSYKKIVLQYTIFVKHHIDKPNYNLLNCFAFE